MRTSRPGLPAPRSARQAGPLRLTSIGKKQQRGDAIKPSETGRYRRKEGRFFPTRPVTWCILVIRRLIAFIYPNSKNTATGRRDKILLNRVITSYGRTSFQLTSSNLVYPGNPQFNRLYRPAHIRTNVTEKRRILVNKHIFELTSPKTYESRLITRVLKKAHRPEGPGRCALLYL